MRDASVFMPMNQYNYEVNIAHPKVQPLFDQYQKENGIFIPSDLERFIFEKQITLLYMDGYFDLGVKK